jgi:hypothetical protein
MIQSEDDRRKGAAIFQTVLICLVLEGLLLLILTGMTGSLVEAIIASVIFLGPVSIWAAPVIYAYILKASE